jgi:hypothetical protein
LKLPLTPWARTKKIIKAEGRSRFKNPKEKGKKGTWKSYGNREGYIFLSSLLVNEGQSVWRVRRAIFLLFLAARERQKVPNAISTLCRI